MAFAHRSAWLILALLANPAQAAAPPVWRVDLHSDRLPAGAVARLGTVRWRQRESAGQLVLSHDGRFLLGAGADQLVVWDVASGKIVRQLHDPLLEEKHPFTRIALAARGKVLLSQNESGHSVFWWDLAAGRWLARSAETGIALQGQAFSLHVLAVSPDGQGSAVGVRGSRMRKDFHSLLLLYDQPATRSARRLRFPEEVIQSLAFSTDGKVVTGMFLATDRWIVRRIEMSSGRIQQTISTRAVLHAGLACDGSCVAVYDEAGDLSIHDSATGKKRKLCSARGLAGHELSFAAQDRVLLAFEPGRPVVRRFDTQTGKELLPVSIGAELGARVKSLALSSDGKTLALSNGPSAIALIDVETGKRRDEFPGLTHPSTQLAYSADGRYITTLSEEDGLIRWDASTGRQMLRIPGGRADSLLRSTGVLSRDGERLIQAKWRTIEVLALPSGKRLYDWRIPEKAVGKMVISPDDKTLAMLGKDGVLRFWQLPAGTLEAEASPQTRARDPLWMVFSSDGRMLATVDGPYGVELWHVPSGKPAGAIHTRKYLPSMNLRGWQGCFSTDGRKLYSSFGQLLQVWDATERVELPALVNQPVGASTGDGTTGLALSADGRFLARVDGEGKLCLLETASGEVVHRFSGLHGAIAFAPTGWRLATEDRDSLTIPIVDLPSLFLSRPPLSPDGSSAESLWTELAHADAARAQQAAWEMTRIERVESFLAGKLTPVSPAVGKHVSALIAALGADEFTTRNKAEQELAGMRDSARKALETALQRETDLEIKHRLHRLLRMISTPSLRLLQELRAVMVLEALGTADARELLRRLAGGLPEARLTEEATTALRRLDALNARRGR
jgi:WD40 repeat protein